MRLWMTPLLGVACLASGLYMPTQAQPRQEAREHTAHVRLRMPTGLVAEIQIGENRYYRWRSPNGQSVLDLGLIEQGWNPFRLYKIKGSSQSCSGGFEAKGDALLTLQVVHAPTGLRCTIR